jgi:hypothetical protein
MHQLFVVLCLTMLLGCAKQETFEAPTVPPVPSAAVTSAATTPLLPTSQPGIPPGGGTATPTATTQGRAPAKLGAMCGGIAGIQCEPGLRCVPIGKGADMSGFCRN